MIGLVMNALFESYVKTHTLHVPKVMCEDFEDDQLNILCVNFQHMNQEKKLDLINWSKSYNIIFAMETWTNSLNLDNFDKYTYPNMYYNILFIRKNISANVDINGYGFQVIIDKHILQFMYIPPKFKKKDNIQFPNGTILGDLNWKHNKFAEPIFHENSRDNRQGMSALNVANDPIFADYERSDHQILILRLKYKHVENRILDNHKVVRNLIDAGYTGKYITPTKRKDNTGYTAYHSYSFWYRNYKRPNSKIFNSSMFGEKSLDLWYELLKHDKNKKLISIKSDIKKYEWRKIHSKARDSLGIAYNDVLEIFRRHTTKPQFIRNLLNAVRNNNRINTLMLKKKEFAIDKFNIKDFRLICIMPVYLKLVEQQLDVQPVHNVSVPNLVGFTPSMDVHTLLALLNRNIN